MFLTMNNLYCLNIKYTFKMHNRSLCIDCTAAVSSIVVLKVKCPFFAATAKSSTKVI